MIELGNFRDARVLVIGDVMLDQYWWGSVDRISPEAPVPIVRLDRTSSTPGGAANVAANAAALGAEVRLIGLIGDDEAGSQLRSDLKLKGISSDRLCVSKDRRTNVKTRVLAHGQQVTRVDVEDATAISDGDAAEILARLKEAVGACDVVVLSDYAKGVLRRDVIEAAITDANAAGKKVLVDPKGKDYTKYDGATIITPNRREAADACKLEEASEELVANAGERLLSDLHLDAAVITESENGMTLFTREGTVHFAAHTHEVYDVTGAGDTVIGCLAVALASGHDLRDACYLANIAGGLSVQQIGTSTVTLEMLEDELKRGDTAADASRA